MTFKQPKPDSKKYDDLIHGIKHGVIKVPKFQRDFVWSKEKTANLLDSILKGYPIGTFIMWETDERMNDIKNIGDIDLPDSPSNQKVQYVLDGQQRITSLFAAYRGVNIQKEGEKKETSYKEIYVNLYENADEDNDQIVSAEPICERHVPLHDVLNFKYETSKDLLGRGFRDDEIEVINEYWKRFQTYDFSTVILKKDDIDSAIEVFTRINTGGQTLTLFEIMSAKTYDEAQGFDMQAKWKEFSEEVGDIGYEDISSMVVLNLLSLVLSKTKESKRKIILALDKQDIIDTWDDAISAIKDSIGYFQTTYRIPVSRLLPYDSLLVPFSYFFFRRKDEPDATQRKYLEEFFWRVSLSYRYSSSTETRLTQDSRRIDKILKNKRPDYDGITVSMDAPEALIDLDFSGGNSFCKAILCLLAYHEPKDFHDGGKVILNNSYLKQANSKNFHHFFPKKFLENNDAKNYSNSIVNITLVSDRLNKREIRAKAPSQYIGKFAEDGSDVKNALKSHLIEMDGFGIKDDDYAKFLEMRAQKIFDELTARINPDEPK